jgi:hypothetical protein
MGPESLSQALNIEVKPLVPFHAVGSAFRMRCYDPCSFRADVDNL